MKFECPYCEQHLESDGLPADSEVSCPSCGRAFRPGQSPDSGSEPAAQNDDATLDPESESPKHRRLSRLLKPLFSVVVVSWLCWATYMLIEIKDETDSCASSSQVSRLKSQVSDIEDDIRRVRSDVSSIESDVSSIESDVSSIESDVSSIESDVSSIESDVSSIESDVSSIESDVETIEDEVTSKYGFTLRSAVEKIKNR